MSGLTAHLRAELASDLHDLLSAEGERSKWQLLESLQPLGWDGLSGTDVNSVLYETGRDFVHDDRTPPRWWVDQAEKDNDAASIAIGALPATLGGDQSSRDASAPSRSNLGSTLGLDLYKGHPPRAWQQEALQAWRAAGQRGVIEAVTGTGKTIVGILAAAEAVAKGNRVLVIVPGLDLLDQWHDRLRSDLPEVSVGCRGGGFQDDLHDHEVLVATAQSACHEAIMPHGRQGLLIADEVHRYGAEKLSLVLESAFTARLGLTATYERNDEGIERHLAPYFSGDEPAPKPGSEVVARCGYERGLADDILARFRVALVGVDFTPAERQEHDVQDERVKRLGGQLIHQHGCPEKPFGEFIRAVTQLSEGDNPDPVGVGKARQYLGAFNKRRALLADCGRKLTAFEKLAPVLMSSTGGLVFTETKESATSAAETLETLGVSAQAYTSSLHRSARKDALEAFREGSIRVLCAPRVLDEGVDVPKADVGVIVASSHSRRQMVQRMGRIIRPNADGGCASFVILYVRGTSEDPASGAHHAFLEEMTDVAENQTTFPPNLDARDLLKWHEEGKLTRRPAPPSVNEHPRATTHEERLLLELYDGGARIDHISKKMGRPPGEIKLCLRDLGRDEGMLAQHPDTRRVTPPPASALKVKRPPAWLQEIQADHPKAYAKWTRDEERTLLRLLDSGMSIDRISKKMGRQPSGIEGRLRLLGRLG